LEFGRKTSSQLGNISFEITTHWISAQLPEHFCAVSLPDKTLLGTGVKHGVKSKNLLCVDNNLSITICLNWGTKLKNVTWYWVSYGFRRESHKIFCLICNILCPGGHCFHSFVFKHPEDAPSIVRDGKSTAFVESRFCFFSRFRFFRVCCVWTPDCYCCRVSDWIVGAGDGWMVGRGPRDLCWAWLFICGFVIRAQVPYIETHGVWFIHSPLFLFSLDAQTKTKINW
jgi:hypothetical protein